jgi:hypothetical protein
MSFASFELGDAPHQIFLKVFGAKVELPGGFAGFLGQFMFWQSMA